MADLYARAVATPVVPEGAAAAADVVEEEVAAAAAVCLSCRPR